MEIRLIVNRQGDDYTAEWDEQDGQRSDPFPLVLPLTGADGAELRWYLETYTQFPGAGDHAAAARVADKIRDWGHAIFRAVFGSAEGTHVYRNLMDSDPPRLLTIGANDPAVFTQPWELIRDRRGPLPFQGVVVRRQLQGSRPTRRRDLTLPLRILLIVSRPNDLGFLDPRTSARPLLDAIEGLPPGQAQLEFCDPPTLAHLEEMISQARRDGRPFHVVHFDGHGGYEPEAGVGLLCFEDDEARRQLVSGPMLGDLLARLDVPLVVLEACRTADLDRRPVFGSVAPALLESGVGSVVAFSHAVHVRAAQLLVERFYGELCTGLTVGQALDEGRACLHANPARWLHPGPNAATVDLQDWFIVQLYQVGEDPRLFPAAPVGETAPVVRPSISLPDFPPPPL
jgi:hypothetical protein